MHRADRGSIVVMSATPKKRLGRGEKRPYRRFWLRTCTRWHAGWMGRRRTSVRICRGALAVVLLGGLTSRRGNLLHGAIRRTTFGLLRPVLVTKFVNTGRVRYRLCAACLFAAGLSAANFGRLKEASLPPPRRAASISGGRLPEIQFKPPAAIDRSQADDPRRTTAGPLTTL
jgi:hypothetical protein